MTATYHEIVDGTIVEISGTGGRSIDQLRSLYNQYQVSEPDHDPDIRCELTTEEPDSDVVLGWPARHYWRDGDRFVFKRNGSFFTTSEDWSVISTTPDWEPYFTVYVIEFELRRRMAQAGWALLHGCGFQFNGQTILCPSLRGAGKTNTFLSVLQAGGSHLSDDRVWVNGQGDVRGYQVPINPHTEQYQSFPELLEPDGSLRSQVFDTIDAHLDPNRSILDKGVLFLGIQFLADNGRSFENIQDLISDVKYVPESETDRLLLLRAAPGRSQISVEPISTEELSRALKMIHHYEWNAELAECFLAFDSLFPEGKMSEQLDYVRTTEEAIFDALLDSVPKNIFKIPRERNWDESGISSDMLTKLEALSEQKKVV